jgi:hypothetical protein
MDIYGKATIKANTQAMCIKCLTYLQLWCHSQYLLGKVRATNNSLVIHCKVIGFQFSIMELCRNRLTV